MILSKEDASGWAVLLQSKEDKEDEQEEEKDGLDDSVEILCFSFKLLFKFISCDDKFTSSETSYKQV